MALALVLCALIGCNSIPKINRPKVSGDPCANADWFEVGRLDALQGISQSASLYVGRCPNQLDSELYNAGWNRGLIDFCRPERGYDAGRSGLEYTGICPVHVEAAFLRAFNAGKEISKLEKDNLLIEQELAQAEALRSPLDPGSPQSKLEQAKLELEKLRERRKRNEIAIRNLEARRAL